MGGEYFAANLKVLRFIGAWNDHPVGSGRRRAYHALTAYVAVALLLHLCTQFAHMATHVGDLEEVTYGFNLATIYALTVVKLAVLLRGRERLARVLERLEGWTHSGWGGAADVLDEGRSRADQLTRFFIAMTAVATCLFFLSASLTLFPIAPPCDPPTAAVEANSSALPCRRAARKLVYPARFPFDAEGGAGGHAAALLFQLAGPAVFGASTNIASDALLVSLLVHLQHQFRAVGRLLAGLDSRVSEMTGAAPAHPLARHGHEELRYALLKECIVRHQELFSLFATVNKIFSPVLFMQCFFSSCVYCIILFHLTMVHNSGVTLVKNVMYLLTIFSQLLMFCWFGSEIFEESVSVAEAAYSTTWYRSSARFKRCISAMICRAQRPVRVTGASLYLINLETLNLMVSSAFSYYTVLRKLYAD